MTQTDRQNQTTALLPPLTEQ